MRNAVTKLSNKNTNKLRAKTRQKACPIMYIMDPVKGTMDCRLSTLEKGVAGVELFFTLLDDALPARPTLA